MRPSRPRSTRALVAVLAVCIAMTAATGTYVAAIARGPSQGLLSAMGGGPAAGDSRDSPQPSGAPPDSLARVAPLGRIIPPTLLIVARQTIPRGKRERVARLDEVKEVAAFDAGRVRMAGRRVNMFAVDPSTFRSWTPPPTASSDRLWAGLVEGEMAVSFAAKKALGGLELGRSYVISGRRARPVALSAAAALGLPAVDVLVNERLGQALGLVPDLGMLINAPGAELDSLERSVRKVLGKGVQVLQLRSEIPTGSSGGSGNTLPSGKPRTYKQLYMRAAQRCPGLSWTVLAAIGQIESGHGRNLGPSSAGALGPMQFMPATWRTYGMDGDGDGEADIMNPYDAVPSAAHYLCVNGAGNAPGKLRGAVYAYNHAWWYVREVLALARRYGS